MIFNIKSYDYRIPTDNHFLLSCVDFKIVSQTNHYSMKNKDITLALVLLVFSFLFSVFAFWTRLAHWQTEYFFLGSGIAVLLAAGGIIVLVVRNKPSK